MLKRSLIVVPIFLLLLSSAFPQGRGGRQGQQQNQGQSRQQGQVQGQGGVQAGDVQKEQKRIHATTQQKEQIRTCDKLADTVRKQAGKMAKASGGKFNAEAASRQQSQIRDQVRTMEQEHERLVNGFDAAQHQAWQDQIRNMNQLRQQLNSHLRQMDAELNSTNPDPKRVSERAREIERTMNNWRTQYRVLSSQAAS